MFETTMVEVERMMVNVGRMRGLGFSVSLGSWSLEWSGSLW